MAEKEIGEVFAYFSKIGVAAIKLKQELKVGQTIRIKGATTDFEQEVESMQIEGKSVDLVGPGVEVGVKFIDKARKHDKVYLVE